MLNEKSIKRLLSVFKNMSLQDISLIQSAYSNRNITKIREIYENRPSKTKMSKPSTDAFILAVGRWANQYTNLLDDSTNEESKILEQINPDFVQYDYNHNLILFGNLKKIFSDDIDGIIKIEPNKPKSYEKQTIYAISTLDELLMILDKITQQILHERGYKYRIIAKYRKIGTTGNVYNARSELIKENDKYISCPITDNLDVVFEFLNSLEYMLDDYEEYDEYSNYELIEIHVNFYKPFLSFPSTKRNHDILPKIIIEEKNNPPKGIYEIYQAENYEPLITNSPSYEDASKWAKKWSDSESRNYIIRSENFSEVFGNPDNYFPLGKEPWTHKPVKKNKRRKSD